jgi:hypothetical protein
MITKYNMTSGELTYQTAPEEQAATGPSPSELANLITSLQLIEIEVTHESNAMPADLFSISVEEFLRHQG